MFVTPLAEYTLLFLVVDALAAFRIVRFVQKDSFPPIAWLRRWGDRRAPDVVHELVWACPWCLGFWVAVGVVVARFNAEWWGGVGAALAVAALVGFLYERQKD